jgi:glutamine kinase
MRIAYMNVVGDLFHYGHLQSILFAKSISDKVICGVMTDEVVESYRIKPIANLHERKAIFENLAVVDEVMIQYSRTPENNLEAINQKYPEAKLILVHGDNWKTIPGSDFINKIGGEVIKHPYYARLSTFKIVNSIITNQEKYKDIVSFSSIIGKKSINNDKTIISTKANTLKTLQPLLRKSRIETPFIISTSEWRTQKEKVIDKIQNQFLSQKIVVRSSAISEDTENCSMAGYFESVLNIDSSSKEEIEKSITTVFNSYKEKNANSSFNQVLIQKQTTDSVISGVIFTRTLEKNAPYYVINYDDSTGSTDSVTSGKENKSMMILHNSSTIPDSMKSLIESIKEIESLIPLMPLDIEFSINSDGIVTIFQVRPLATNKDTEIKDEEFYKLATKINSKVRDLMQPVSHLQGQSNILADMPDWNPAEIIGDKPNLLDYSLYDYIITNTAWHEARTSQGYYNVAPAKLVERIGNKPFVNVRNTFNSFIISSIPHELHAKLVEFSLQKLKQNPHLQDKVEFEILFTCYDLTFNQRAHELRENGFSEEEISILKEKLHEFTNNIIQESSFSIVRDLNEIESLEQIRVSINNTKLNTIGEKIRAVQTLLDSCKEKGTVQFSRLARLGFIAKTLLRGFVNQNVIRSEEFNVIYNSINTVATEISEDFKKIGRQEISKEMYLKKYGHLRPGTYNITSPRYDKNPDLLAQSQWVGDSNNKNQPMLTRFEEKFDKILKDENFAISGKEFITFVQKATEAREKAKFEFTKNLSDALELLAEIGHSLGFTREEISQLDINDILQSKEVSTEEIITNWKQLISEEEKIQKTNNLIELPSIIKDVSSLETIQHYTAKPNYITQKKIHGKAINITQIDNKNIPEIEGNIVVLENGDPGFDWIFTRNPAGLITKYGGIASHMSIRCAEFGIPAAIGCGETIFSKIKDAEKILLDCNERKIFGDENIKC